MKFTQSRIIYTKRNSTNFKVEFISNLKESLNDFDFRTKVEGTTIEFKRVFRSIAPVGIKRDPFKNLRTGRIIVTVQSINLIKTKSIINLSHLTFLSISMGIAIFLFHWFWNLNLIIGGIFSVITMAAVFIIGWINISGKINRIITIAVKKVAQQLTLNKSSSPVQLSGLFEYQSFGIASRLLSRTNCSAFGSGLYPGMFLWGFNKWITGLSREKRWFCYNQQKN